MKLYKFLILIFILFIPCSVFAYVNTYERSVTKPLVPNDVVVDDKNINNILDTPAVSSYEKIYDFIDVFSNSEKEELKKNINNFTRFSNMDVVVVCTDDLLGYSISDYTYQFYDFNDFLDNGVILVIYKSSDDTMLYMGNSGFSVNIYTDDVINETLKYIYDDISNGKYYNGVNNYLKIIDGFYRKSNYGNNHNWFELVLFSFVISLVVTLFIKHKYFKNNNSSVNNINYFDKKVDLNSLTVKTLKDELIDDEK